MSRCPDGLASWCPGVVCVLVSGAVHKACLLDGGLSLYQHIYKFIYIYIKKTRKARRAAHRALGARGVQTASDRNLCIRYDVTKIGMVMFMDASNGIFARRANVCVTHG